MSKYQRKTLRDLGIDKECLKITVDQGKDKEVTNRVASN